MKKTLIYIIILIMILISGCTGVPEATDTINTYISDTEIITETGDDVTMPDEYGEYTPTDEVTTDTETDAEITDTETDEITTEPETTNIETDVVTEEVTTEGVTEEDTTDYESNPIYVMYMEALEKSRAVDSFSMIQFITQEYKMTFENGQKLQMIYGVHYDETVIGLHGDDAKYRVKQTVYTSDGRNGEEVVTEVYADRDKYYVKDRETSEYTVTERSDPDAVIYDALLQTFNDPFDQLPARAFAKLRVQGDTYKTIYGYVDKKSIKAVFGDLESLLFSTFEALGASDIKVSAKDACIDLYFKSGENLYHSEYTLNYSIDLTLNGMSVSSDVKLLIHAHMSDLTEEQQFQMPKV